MEFFKKVENLTFIKSFRTLALVLLMFSSFYSLAQEDPLKLYQSKDYSGAVRAVEAKRGVESSLSYKDHVVLIKSFEKLSQVNRYIEALRSAMLVFPKKDVFKRELAAALEKKADSHANNRIYDKILNSKEIKSDEERAVQLESTAKVLLQKEAAQILNTLYDESPTKENFTSLVKFYERRQSYSEALGLLELYGRSKPKGIIYYSYLCEVQYKAKLYSTALETCRSLSKRYPEKDTGHFYYVKSLEMIGEKNQANEGLLKLRGRFPASDSMQFEIGKALIEKGKHKEGLEHLEKHINLNPSDEALVLKAETLFKLGSREKALSTFVKACKQHQEPRKPLITKIRKAARSLERQSEMRKKYEKEMRACKLSYRPNKQNPKGSLGSSYSQNQ